MITIPTVLVFGAGVSRPFGYPIGVELRDQIINNLQPNNSHYRELVALGFSTKTIEGFCKAFRYSGKESVDAFLEHREDFIDVGKAAIAQELIKHERNDILFDKTTDNNLYYYLYKHLNAIPEEFKENTISVLTYNYDRSFEQFLFNSLKYSYRLSDEKTAVLMEHVPIVHLHGHLGLLPWQGEDGRKYYPKIQLTDLGNASKSIRIIHEQVDVDREPQFQKAYHCIRDAERLIFLGFGYDKTNLARLNVPTDSSNIRIFGSCLGLSENERVNMNHRIFRENISRSSHSR